MRPRQQVEKPVFHFVTDASIVPLVIWDNHPDFALGLTWQQLQEVGVAILNLSMEGMKLEKRQIESAVEAVDSDTLEVWIPADIRCRYCKSYFVRYRIVTSDDGAHEDTNYQCQQCIKEWWIDGPDY